MSNSINADYNILEDGIVKQAAGCVLMGGGNCELPVVRQAVSLLKQHRQIEFRVAAKRVPQPRLWISDVREVESLYHEFTAFLSNRQVCLTLNLKPDSDVIPVVENLRVVA